jgi:hypothetical protein
MTTVDDTVRIAGYASTELLQRRPGHSIRTCSASQDMLEDQIARRKFLAIGNPEQDGNQS